MILALAQLNHPNYAPALWQGTLVYWGVMAVAILINTTASKFLPKLDSHSHPPYRGIFRHSHTIGPSM